MVIQILECIHSEIIHNCGFWRWTDLGGLWTQLLNQRVNDDSELHNWWRRGQVRPLEIRKRPLWTLLPNEPWWNRLLEWKDGSRISCGCKFGFNWGSSKVGQWVAGASFHFSDILNKNGKLSTGDALNWDKGWLEHHQALVWVGRPTVWSHMRSLSTSSKVGRGANDAHAINEFELAMC